MKFHYLARGIIFHDGKVLLAHLKGADNTFLPGGHIEMGEKAETALVREIQEEIGKEARVRRFVGALECVFTESGQKHHEVELLFELDVVGVSSARVPESKENYLECLWSAPDELGSRHLLPEPLVDCLLNWEQEYQAYFGSSFS